MAARYFVQFWTTRGRAAPWMRPRSASCSKRTNRSAISKPETVIFFAPVVVAVISSVTATTTGAKKITV